MISKQAKRSLRILGLFLGLSLVLAAPSSAGRRRPDPPVAPPLYEPVDIGAIIRNAYPTAGISSGWALNESGDVVGAALIDGQYQAFIYTHQWGLEILPPLPGWTNHIGQDVSDRDPQGSVLIVGGGGQTTGLSDSDPGRAALWVYDAALGQVLSTVDVGTLPGAGVSELTAVNNNGLAVGYSRIAVTQGPIEPMVYEASTDTLHPLALSDVPVDINDANQVLAGTDRAQLSQDPGTGVISVSTIDDLSTGPGRVASRTTGLNDLGWASGVTSMGYGDGAGRIVTGSVLYSGTWDVVWFGSAFDVGRGLNVHGDVVGDRGVSSAIRATLYIRALDQTFLLSDLTDPPFFSSSARDINDAGWISGGAASAVLWKRVGDMPVPTAPANLTAVPHEPTWVQPWNAISLTWEDTSTLTRSFFIERRVSGTSNWTEIKTNWSNSQLWDTDVGLGVTYDYRVRAKGIAGFSEYSDMASATAPSDPVDTEAPVVSIANPDGTQPLSGRVSVVVEASDNIGVTYMEVEVHSSLGRTTLCSAADVTSLDCNWNTRKLAPGSYQLRAMAIDAMNNGSYDLVTVQVEGA